MAVDQVLGRVWVNSPYPRDSDTMIHRAKPKVMVHGDVVVV